MAECKQQLKPLTKQFKVNVQQNLHDFDGMTFVKSECVYVDGFKL